LFCNLEQLMSLKRSLLLFATIFLLVSIACSGVESSPPATPIPTSPAVSTATPTQESRPTQPSEGPGQPGGLESVTVASVVDGDTVELSDGRRVRYIGVNTPERNQPYYPEASETNRQLVEGKTVQLELDVETFDQYGRTLAYVWVNGVMANMEIIRLGFANAFTVPPNVRYEAEFRAAEREAREAGRGLWAGSDSPLKIVQIEADAPGSDSQNPNGEWIEIVNQGDAPVSMQGYTLKDQANHIYTFGDVTLRARAAVRLYSGQGQDSESELYWGLVGESVWNNDSDSAFLRDAQGALVDTFAY
jgi:micrococcal nuclease